MNKNTKHRSAVAHKSFGRIRAGRGSSVDELIAKNVGHRESLDAKPKVARSAAEISRRLSR